MNYLNIHYTLKVSKYLNKYIHKTENTCILNISFYYFSQFTISKF